MIVSREEAVGLFRKWKTDDVPVAVFLMAGLIADGGTPQMSVSLGGFIFNLSDSVVEIGHMTPMCEVVANFALNLAVVERFEYRETGEASEPQRRTIAGRISSSLQMFWGGLECVIYELCV